MLCRLNSKILCFFLVFFSYFPLNLKSGGQDEENVWWIFIPCWASQVGERLADTSQHLKYKYAEKHYRENLPTITAFIWIFLYCTAISTHIESVISEYLLSYLSSLSLCSEDVLKTLIWLKCGREASEGAVPALSGRRPRPWYHQPLRLSQPAPSAHTNEIMPVWLSDTGWLDRTSTITPSWDLIWILQILQPTDWLHTLFMVFLQFACHGARVGAN